VRGIISIDFILFFVTEEGMKKPNLEFLGLTEF
jgi:hypothetical protein